MRVRGDELAHGVLGVASTVQCRRRRALVGSHAVDVHGGDQRRARRERMELAAAGQPERIADTGDG
jgi:hypothetical protein